MAIDSITITQDNIVNGSNLVPVHSTLVFLAEVSYTGATPDLVYVDVIVDGEVEETFKAIPYSDPLGTIRTFAFVANDVVKSLIGVLDDFGQLLENLTFVEEITKLVTIKFYDPETPATSDSVEVDLIHGAGQFGENPNFEEIYNNDPSTYYGGDGQFMYVYFYNDDVANILTIDNPSANLVFAQDYDDDIFTDYDDTQFQIDIAI